MDLGRGDAAPGAGAARGGARRGDEGVGPVVEVEHGALRALEEDRAPRVDPLREQQRGVGDVGRQPAREAKVRPEDPLHRESLRVVDLAQDAVLLGDVVLELLPEELGIEEIGHPDADAGGLVGIGGPHALAGGADAPLARLGFRRAVQRRVIRHDQVRVLGDVEVAVQGDPALHQRLHLLDHGRGVHHHPAADHAPAARAEDARGQRLEDELLAPHHDGVPGVVAALIAHHRVHVRGQHVHQLALGLVAPLRAHDHDVRHHHCS